jgi:hypothetical protein
MSAFSARHTVADLPGWVGAGVHCGVTERKCSKCRAVIQTATALMCAGCGAILPGQHIQVQSAPSAGIVRQPITVGRGAPARPRCWLGWPGRDPVGACSAGGGWVGRGQDKQDPANSESMT